MISQIDSIDEKIIWVSSSIVGSSYIYFLQNSFQTLGSSMSQIYPINEKNMLSQFDSIMHPSWIFFTQI